MKSSTTGSQALDHTKCEEDRELLYTSVPLILQYKSFEDSVQPGGLSWFDTKISYKNLKWVSSRLGGCTVLNMYEYTWVHRRDINLNIAVLRINTINTFKTKNIHVYLH